MTVSQKRPSLCLVDGSGYIFRAYYALPNLYRKSDGLPTGAVSGFCNMLYKLMQKIIIPKKFTHFAIVFDTSRVSFRNKIYSDYKANRSDPPEDLIPQFRLIREAVKAFSIESVEQVGYEADDLIATYTNHVVKLGGKVTIISSDKDLMQLISKDVGMIDTKKDVTIDSNYVKRKFDVYPESLIDVQALAGDSTDNVPGIPGIGMKTAAELINRFKTLDNLFNNIEKIEQTKRREKIENHKNDAYLSKKLVTLKKDVSVKKNVKNFILKNFDPELAIDFLNELEFKQLSDRISSKYKVIQKNTSNSEIKKNTKKSFIKNSSKDLQQQFKTIGISMKNEKQVIRKDSIRSVEEQEIKVGNVAYVTLKNVSDLDEWVLNAQSKGYLIIDTETDSLDTNKANLIGISLSVEFGKACYIPIQHKGDLNEKVENLPLNLVIKKLKNILEDSSVKKIGQNIKYDMAVLSRYDINLFPIEDTMLMSYILYSGLHRQNLDTLSEKYLNIKKIDFDQITGKGKSKLTFDKVSLSQATQYSAEDADMTNRLYYIFSKRIVREKLLKVYETLEKPIVPILVKMEKNGIKVDKKILQLLSKKFEKDASKLEEKIFKITGSKFNIGSPKQLGEMLFEKLAIKGGKKTKNLAYSTSADVLENLSYSGHAIAKLILDWRQITKLRNTYTDSLQEFINKNTKRVHTSYSLAATTTGRLSSSEPNLQNIPIKSQEGREIRKAFVAEKGKKLVSADYNQIELRILSHVANSKNLKNAFIEKQDIHSLTASQIFGIPLSEVDMDQRRKAKTINFGIIYGISPFGLSKQLSITRSEATQYINSYFAKYSGIKEYMDSTIKDCRKLGYVKTIFGRRCNFPGINSKNYLQRSLNERAAINAPIQGSAADIIRRAMIKIDNALSKNIIDCRMLLQVHDELIFEVSNDKKEIDNLKELVTVSMAKAAEPFVYLDVPLTIDIKVGNNWNEAH